MKKIKNVKSLNLFGVELFQYTDCIEFSEDSTRYHECIFKIKSMEKFNGLDCVYHQDGLLTILDENDNEVWEKFACKIPGFYEKTLKEEVNNNLKNNKIILANNLEEYDIDKTVYEYGIPIFAAEDIEYNMEETVYRNCKFSLYSMQEYNGLDCEIDYTRMLIIKDKQSNIIWKGYFYEISEISQKIKKEFDYNTLYKLNMDDFKMALEEMGEDTRTEVLKKYSVSEIKDIFQRKFSPNWIEDIQSFIENYLLNLI